jgi:LytS/YehU family sensor histidine kinase
MESSLVLELLSFDMFGDILLFTGILSLFGYVDHILCRNQDLFTRLAAKKALLAEEEKQRLLAELKSLQSQMNPHFLFNTLNAVASLIVTNADKAEDLVRDMSDWYRNVHGAMRQATWTIQNEIELVMNYLKIESVRLEKRLAYDIQCPQKALLISIPPLILQPLVENAIQHSIAPSLSGGKLIVIIQGSPDRFSIMVQDYRHNPELDVSGLKAPGTGSSLENIKRRLELAFGERVRFSLTPQDNGTEVKIIFDRGL